MTLHLCVRWCALPLALVLSWCEAVVAQTAAQPGPTATASEQVVIKRAPIELISPEIYKLPLSLEPVRSVELAAPIDGFVQRLSLSINEKALAQAEAVQLDGTAQKLQLERAKALLQAAQVELRIAQGKQDADQVALAEARLAAARTDVSLAEHGLSQTSVRVPFAADVFRVAVVEGEFVRAGQPLMTLADTSVLKVEIPINRESASAGSTVSIQVEGSSVQAQVESVLPLSPKFESLRTVFESVASATVLIDNAGRRFSAGQTTFAPLIPRQPVTEVPATAVSNAAGGERKVQVVRKETVRDVVVQLLTQVGTDRLYVSGAFAPGDEVITESSRPLPDGTVIRASGAPQTAATTESPAASTKTPAAPRPATRPSVGF